MNLFQASLLCTPPSAAPVPGVSAGHSGTAHRVFPKATSSLERNLLLVFYVLEPDDLETLWLAVTNHHPPPMRSTLTTEGEAGLDLWLVSRG